MKNIIKLHSFIDVITNSSTEIYVNPHEKSIEATYNVLSEILKWVWITQDPKELYDVYYMSSAFIKAPTDEDLDKGKDIYDFEKTKYSDPDVKLSKEDAIAIMEYQSDNDNNYTWLYIVIEDKKWNKINIWDKLKSIFNIDACYDG